VDDHPPNGDGWAKLQTQLDSAASQVSADVRKRGFSERTARLAAERVREELPIRALELDDAIKLVETYGGRVDPPRARSRQRGGRPAWSGAFVSREHFLAVMREAVDDIRAGGRRPTKKMVSRWLDDRPDEPKASPRTLLNRAQDCGYPTWDVLLAELQ
jgi:hypothetical protein